MTQADIEAAEDAVVTSKLSQMTDNGLLRLSRLLEDVFDQRATVKVTARKALMTLVKTIDATGGLIPDSDSLCGYSPAGDPEWADLADAYCEACQVLGREPLTGEAKDEVTEEDGPEDPEVSDR